MKKTPSFFLPIILILLVAGSLGGGYVLMNAEKLFPKPKTPIASTPLIVHEQWRKDGDNYSVTWEYPTSGGRTGKIGFVVNLNQDRLTKADIKILTTNDESKAYQVDFQKSLSKAVVGKKISELANLDAIGGASTTTENFKAAVAALGSQLKI